MADKETQHMIATAEFIGDVCGIVDALDRAVLTKDDILRDVCIRNLIRTKNRHDEYRLRRRDEMLFAARFAKTQE